MLVSIVIAFCSPVVAFVSSGRPVMQTNTQKGQVIGPHILLHRFVWAHDSINSCCISSLCSQLCCVTA